MKKVNLSRVPIAVLLFCTFCLAFATMAQAANKVPEAVCVPRNPADLNAPHDIISGEMTTLKAAATDPDGTVDSYQWNFNDGTMSDRVSRYQGIPDTVYDDKFDANVIQAEHAYTGNVGAAVDATLTVWDNLGETATCSYKMAIMADTPEIRTNIAIDRALWWNHKRMDIYACDADQLVQCARIENGGWNAGVMNQAIAIQGYTSQGHLGSGNPKNDPYAQDVKLLVNDVTQFIFVKTSSLKGDGSVDFPLLDPDSPDPLTGIKDGLLMGTAEDQVEYEHGTLLKALVSADIANTYPALSDESWNYTGDPLKSIKNFTYGQIIQNMVDFLAWLQLYDHPINYYKYDPITHTYNDLIPDETDLTPRQRGSWPYWSEGWSDPLTHKWGGLGSTALAFWNVMGLQAAETQGYTVLPWVKDELKLFVSRESGHQNLDPTDVNYGEAYYGPNDGIEGRVVNFHLIERAAEFMTVLAYLGVPPDDERVTASKAFIQNHWNDHNWSIWQNFAGPYPYAVQEGLIKYEVKTGEDWFNKYYWDYNGANGMNYSFFRLYEGEGANMTAGWEEGAFDALGVWQATKQGDDVNLMALYSLSRAMRSYGISDFPSPSTDPAGYTWEERVTELLINNQLANGGYTDQHWVYDSPFSTSWALMTLSEKEPVTTSTNFTLGSINMDSTVKNTTETLNMVVKVVNSVGSPLIGATVTMNLTHDAVTLESGTTVNTDGSGEALFTYSVRKEMLPTGTYTIEVTNVAKSGWTLDTPVPVSESYVK